MRMNIILNINSAKKNKEIQMYFDKGRSYNSYNFSLFNILLLISFLFSSTIALSQDSIIVRGRFIDNTKYAKIVMKKFGVGSFVVGGSVIIKDSFALSLPANIETGVYRFQYAMSESERYLDIIINGKEKEIAFTIQANDENATPVFYVSEENKKWYAYNAQVNALLLKTNLLNQFIVSYPNVESAVVKAAHQELEMEKAFYWESFNAFKTSMQNTWAYEMVVNRPFYFTNPKEDPRIQDYERREHFWDGFNASNPQLLNTPLYTEHILNYIRYWMNPYMNFSAEEKTNGFKRAVDVIIRQFSENQQVHEFAFKYLTLGFKQIGEEEVLQYLDENYKDLANRCFDNFEKTEFDKRMEGYAAMKVGNLAPDFEINRLSSKVLAGGGKGGSLYKVKAEKTIVVFWSSTCPHCMVEMPKLNEWAAIQKEVQVIAVSLDTDPKLHLETIKGFPNMLHSSDYKGWNSEAVSKYYIAATPTFIILDKDKKVVGKYSGYEQIKHVKTN